MSYAKAAGLTLLRFRLIFIIHWQVELLTIAPRGHRPLEDAGCNADGFGGGIDKSRRILRRIKREAEYVVVDDLLCER